MASTPPPTEPASPELEMGTERLEAFSDAVIAVIMTIMAFGLEAPVGTTWAALSTAMPGLFVYVLSFAFIGIYWNNHHHLLRATKRISAGVMWSNLFLLLWLSLIPVCTKWIGDPHSAYKDPLPAIAYGVVCLIAGAAYTLLVRMIIRANGKDSAVARAIASDVKGRVSIGLYAAGVGAALLSPYVSYACYAAVSVMWFVPDRRLSQPAEWNPHTGPADVGRVGRTRFLPDPSQTTSMWIACSSCMAILASGAAQFSTGVDRAGQGRVSRSSSAPT